jgi:isocitrate lyase
MVANEMANSSKKMSYNESTCINANSFIVRTVYISGGLAGYSQATFPGDDHADYPADIVPSIVRRVFNSQLFHDRRQHQLRMKYSLEDRRNLECIDYMLPIVVDADIGFGTLTGCMKLARNSVESGVAMIHIDDLALGLRSSIMAMVKLLYRRLSTSRD